MEKITIIIEGENCKVKVLRDGQTEDREEKQIKSASMYARFFDQSCAGWSKDSEYNLAYLRQQQIHANELLKLKGHLYLNEVYDLLGIPRTKAGQVVGWVYDEKNPIGDNCVDFGIFNEGNESFVNGYEKSVLLDFNVDGNILDYLE